MRLASLLIALTACSVDPLDCPVTTPRAEPTADTEAVVAGNTAFAAAVYQATAAEPGNRFLSPLSISTAMSMVLAGADGETAAQMRDVLGLSVDDPTHHSELGGLLRDLGRSDDCLGTDLSIANGLFAQQGTDLNAAFVDTVVDTYDATAEVVDFHDGGRDHVNDWVEDQTGGQIEELLAPGALGDNPILVLANAIAFEGSWKNAFDPADTADGTFHLADGATVSVPMMSQLAELRYGFGGGLGVVELPYLGDETTFLAVVPTEDLDLPTLEASLSAETVQSWVDLLGSPQEISVRMPLFTFGDQVPLTDVLAGLGMEDLFDLAQADLTRMTSTPAYVSNVVHEGWIQVDEEGTVAVAATAAVVNEKSSPPSIALDRPFLFFIRDTVTGTLLFVGRMSDPS